MAVERLPHPVTSSRSKKRYDVYWDRSSHEVYVDKGGRTYAGEADSVTEALEVAESWLYLNDR